MHLKLECLPHMNGEITLGVWKYSFLELGNNFMGKKPLRTKWNTAPLPVNIPYCYNSAVSYWNGADETGPYFPCLQVLDCRDYCIPLLWALVFCRDYILVYQVRRTQGYGSMGVSLKVAKADGRATLTGQTILGKKGATVSYSNFLNKIMDSDSNCKVDMIQKQTERHWKNRRLKPSTRSHWERNSPRWVSWQAPSYSNPAYRQEH